MYQVIRLLLRRPPGTGVVLKAPGVWAARPQAGKANHSKYQVSILGLNIRISSSIVILFFFPIIPQSFPVCLLKTWGKG